MVLVLFDGGCPMCRTTVRRLHRFDWLHRLTFADATDASADVSTEGSDVAASVASARVVSAGGALAGWLISSGSGLAAGSSLTVVSVWRRTRCPAATITPYTTMAGG